LLLNLHAVIVISGRNLARTAGKLQYRSGNAASDPQAKYGGYDETPPRQDQVDSFQSKIGREFLVERSLQQRDGVCVLGRKRDDVTNENFPGQAQINHLLRREYAIAQHLGDGASVWQRRAKQVGVIEKSDLEVGVDFDFTREIVVDAEHWTKPRNGIRREQWRDRDGVEFAVEHNKRVGGVVRLSFLDQFRKRKRHVVQFWPARVKKKFLVQRCDQHRIGPDPAAETRQRR